MFLILMFSKYRVKVVWFWKVKNVVKVKKNIYKNLIKKNNINSCLKVLILFFVLKK